MNTVVRTVIRAVSVGVDTVIFEIPEWKPGKWFQLSKWSIPPEQRKYLHPGFRCIVEANLDAATSEELSLRNWALP